MSLLIAAILGIVYFGQQHFLRVTLPADPTANSVQVEKPVPETATQSKSVAPSTSATLPPLNAIGLLLLQLLVVVLAARLVGYAFVKIGQPMVIGEIIAGIVIGPTVFGRWLPESSAALFPAASLGSLNIISQLGLIFFMFIIGSELKISTMRRQAGRAVLLSHVSIGFSFLGAALLSFLLFPMFNFAGKDYVSFTLFMGIALSITAFPVMSRIIQERGLTRSSFGVLALSTAASDDIIAWLMLAIVVAVASASSTIAALYSALGLVVFIAFMLMVIRPLINRVGELFNTHERMSRTAFAFIMVIPIFGALITEWLGFHAVFGAFVGGLCIADQHKLRNIITEKIEDLSVVLLLPLFFALTGLRTDLTFLFQGSHVGITLLIIGVALACKGGVITLVSKGLGMHWAEASMLGVLMNTRGLMELIVLNIGYTMGILNTELYAIMVTMALVTTFLTGRSLSIIQRFIRRKSVDIQSLQQMAEHQRILISFGNPDTGKKLLKVLVAILGAPRLKSDLEVEALHVTRNTELTPAEARRFERQSFLPIRQQASADALRIKTHYKNADDVNREVEKLVEARHHTLVLLGSTQALFKRNATGGRVKSLLDHIDCEVAVLIDKGLGSEISKVAYCTESLTSLDSNPITHWILNNPEISSEPTCSVSLRSFLGHHSAEDKPDLVVMSLDYYRQIRKEPFMAFAPSLLLIRPSKLPQATKFASASGASATAAIPA